MFAKLSDEPETVHSFWQQKIQRVWKIFITP